MGNSKIDTEGKRDETDVDKKIREYKKDKPKPVWQFVKDIQLEALFYANIIEQINSGTVVGNKKDLKTRLEKIGMKFPIFGDSLQIDDQSKLLQEIIDRVSACQEALVEVVKKYGGELLNELEFEADQYQSAIVGVNAGLQPSISISVVHTAKTVKRF